MFTFGGLAWTTRLWHSSHIDELMAEPPVLGAGRKSAGETAGETAGVTCLFHSRDADAPADAPVAEPPVADASGQSPAPRADSPSPDRRRAA